MTGSTKQTGALRNRDFLKFWIGETVSLVGIEVTRFALPLVAVLTLSASALEVGVLNALRYVPIVVVSLFAGVWLDRRRRRPVLLGANLSRAILIGTVPAAAAGHVLSMGWLYVVAVVVGVLTVLFDVGSLSYLPSLVGRDLLADANGRLQASFSLAMIAGPSLAGALIGFTSAPAALTLNAASFLFSVVMISLIRAPESAPAVTADRPSVRSSIAEGLRAVYGSPMLRNLLTQSGTYNLFFNAMMTVFVVYAVRTLGLSAAQLGIVLGTGALAALAGSIQANRITRRFGLGRTLVATTILACTPQLLFLLARGPDAVSMAILIGAQAVYGFTIVIFNVNTLTLRQVVTPHRLLGRMNASYRMVLFGTIPFGALLGGALGEYLGLRAAMVITVILLTAPVLWTTFSPVFRLEKMPTGPDEAEPESGAPPATPPDPVPAQPTAEPTDRTTASPRGGQ